MKLGQGVSGRSAITKKCILPAEAFRAFPVVMAGVLWALLTPAASQAQTQSPQFVYEAGGSVINGYELDPTTGALTAVPGSPFNERFDGTAEAVNPAGTFLFVANGNGDNNVSVFAINTMTGALTEVPNSPFSTGLGVNPNVAAVDPSGRFLYVGNQYGTQWPCSAEYDSYSINPATGELTPTPGSTPPSQGADGPINPVGIYVHPNGRWIYFLGGWNNVTSNPGCPSTGSPGSDTVSGFSIDPSTGDLIGEGAIVYSAFPDLPHALTGDPAGQFLYHEYGDTCVYIESLAISPIDGSLTLNSTWSAITPAGLCSSQFGLAVDSTGKFLYSNIAFFSVSDGTMTAIETANGEGESLLTGLILTDPIGPVLMTGSQNYLINPTTGVLTPVTPPSTLGFPLVITGYPPQNAAPGAQYSPAGLTFTNYAVGMASSPQTIALYNTGTATLNISSISLTGANASDFAQTNNCAPSDTLAPGANCVFTVIYTPSTTSAESAEISVSDNATGSPHTAALTATGFVPTPPDGSVTPSSLTFMQTAIGSSSSMNFTISNSGTETLTISGYVFGGANPSEFSQTNNCNGSVGGGAMCMVTVTFAPQAQGNRSATLTVDTNGIEGNSTISLAGQGIMLTSPDTLTNSGSSSATVQAGQPATYNLSVTPAAAYSGTIKISCSVAPAGPACVTSPTAVEATVSNNSTATPVTVTVTPPATGAELMKPREREVFAGGTQVWRMRDGMPGTLIVTSMLPLLIWLVRARRLKLRNAALIAAAGICCAMAACGGSSGTQPPPPQNYSVSVTATAGTNTQTVNLSLTVQ